MHQLVHTENELTQQQGEGNQGDRWFDLPYLESDNSSSQCCSPTPSTPFPAVYAEMAQMSAAIGRANTVQISHEIRTPLTAIKGALSLLAMGKIDFTSVQGQQLLNMAAANADRLVRLAEAIEGETIPRFCLHSAVDFDRLQLSNELKQAWASRAFRLMYQPIVSLARNAISSFEVLVRWPHARRGLVPPAVFVPIAEEIGLIHELGLWILQQACQQLRSWQAINPAIPPSINVNLSACQLTQPRLVDLIQEILSASGVAPTALKLEVTESTLLENQSLGMRILADLRAMGIQLCIDDFGTGYSSLGRLQELPIDVLKVDQTFVQRHQWSIIRAVVSMAHELGLAVVVEGVESREQAIVLQKMGCDEMQGYYFCQPMSGAQAALVYQGSRALATVMNLSELGALLKEEPQGNSGAL